MQSNMKIFRYISGIIAAVAALACSGNVDTDALPILEASSEEVDLAKDAQLTFTVRYNGVDVTGESVIYKDGTAIEGNVYTFEEEGEYEFTAVYAGMTSEPVNVTVLTTFPSKTESKFKRHVSLIEFTGAWCINCPEGYDNMKGILAYPQMTKYKDYIHLAAFHSNVEGTDSLAIPQTQDVIKLFSGLAYPSFATDLRTSGILTDIGAADLRPSIEASFNEYTPYCGVSVASALNAERTSAEVTVKLTSELTAQYRVVLLVVQDQIRGWQKTPTYSDGQDDYLHRHVVRKVVTTYSGTFTGEKMTEGGKIAAGEEAVKTWTVEIDSKWNLDKTEIYALALGADGYVNNMNVCHIDGGDSGYDYK